MAGLSGEWQRVLSEEFRKPYYRTLFNTIREEYRNHTVYPPADEIFTAFHLTPFEKVKVVIIGQDPYHEPGQANGLSFSVKPGIEPPPSLVNIFQEMKSDLNLPVPNNGDLSSWAAQGVLMLNTLLTVRAHQAFSHKGIGWETLTDAAIKAIDSIDRPIVFILWGKSAAGKKEFIKNPNRLVIESAHPSPLSAYRGFFGSRPFSRANEFLVSHGESPVDWRIKNI